MDSNHVETCALFHKFGYNKIHNNSTIIKKF